MTLAASGGGPAAPAPPGPLGPDPDAIAGKGYNPAASRYEPRLMEKAPHEAGGAAPRWARDRARDCREAGELELPSEVRR